MLKTINQKFLIILIISIFSQGVIAQSASNLDSLADDTKNDLLTVVGGGLAGAILGLSTLSFVEEPKDHTNNILMGASLGIIAGVAFVAASQATKTSNMMYGSYQKDAKDFDSLARNSWHHENNQVNQSPQSATPWSIGYSTRF